MKELNSVISHFLLKGTVSEVKPLGSGLINDSYLVTTAEADQPDYVLQRINHAIFTDVELLQRNIEAVTRHLRRKLEAEGVGDIQRRVLQFLSTDEDRTCHFDGTNYWRMSVFIADTLTIDEVTPHSSYDAGKAFGRFEQQLIDLPESLGETIPDFHNMELRIKQLSDAVSRDVAGRVADVGAELELIRKYSEEMCLAEQLHRQGLLPKRICHCDTKVNNMLFDHDGNVLCVIDLDTVMPAYIFSDFGDFLRTAANTVAEDSPELEKIDFRWDIFEAFSRGYLESTASFLTDVERDNLPFAVALFPMMQAVRFLADYLNGDTYYKINYPEHNLVRTRNQLRYFQRVMERRSDMEKLIRQL
ncbi:MAG: aminoglycoside phosphotransferase family protein [Prevotella sp.]|nr:aminoglycoside phosphotransferase family protein [Prevotella sp.]